METKLLYRRLTAFLILVAFLLQTFDGALIVIDYYANTAEYAAHCINKDKPQMHCNGKCQMIKKIQQEEKKDQNNPERKSDNKNEITLIAKSYFASVPPLILTTESLKRVLLNPDYNSTDASLDIFHPPQV